MHRVAAIVSTTILHVSSLMFSVVVKSETEFNLSLYSEGLGNPWPIIVAGYSVC